MERTKQSANHVFDEYKLLDRPLGTKLADDAFVQKLANTFSSGTPTDAARAAAEALRDGIDPKAIGEAISLAATQLVLRDPGRIPQWEDRLKPAGQCMVIPSVCMLVMPPTLGVTWRWFVTAGASWCACWSGRGKSRVIARSEVT